MSILPGGQRNCPPPIEVWAHEAHYSTVGTSASSGGRDVYGLTCQDDSVPTKCNVASSSVLLLQCQDPIIDSSTAEILVCYLTSHAFSHAPPSAMLLEVNRLLEAIIDSYRQA